MSLSEGTRRALVAVLLETGHDAAAQVLDRCSPRAVFEVPGYVARVAGTDHAESAHTALSDAGQRAVQEGRAVVVIVTPARRDGDPLVPEVAAVSPYVVACPACEAKPGNPCRTIYRANTSSLTEPIYGDPLEFVHSEREAAVRGRRDVRPDAEDEAFVDAERIRACSEASLRRPVHGGHPEPGYILPGGGVES